MHVTVDIKGDHTERVELAADATYADVLQAVDLSPQEATVLVDGRPVPDTDAVDTTTVTVLRLVKGG